MNKPSFFSISTSHLNLFHCIRYWSWRPVQRYTCSTRHYHGNRTMVYWPPQRCKYNREISSAVELPACCPRHHCNSWCGTYLKWGDWCCQSEIWKREVLPPCKIFIRWKGECKCCVQECCHLLKINSLGMATEVPHKKPMFLYINVYLFLFDITSFIYFASRSNINKIELSNKKRY